MKKVVTLLLALCTFAVAAAQTTLPYIARDKDKSGKYGFVQKGKEIFPHIFEDARSFMSGEALTHVAFGKEYFVIDRKGNMVTNKSYELPPRIYPRFAIVDWKVKKGINSESGIVLNSRGDRLFPGLYAAAIHAKTDDYLFVVSKDRGEYNGQLATIDGKIINKNLRGKFFFSASEVIKYTDNSPEHKMGVLNAWGKILIPCKYSDLYFCYLYNLHHKQIKTLEKAGIMDKYSSDMLQKIGVILAYEGRVITVYDQCGNMLVSPKQYKSTYHTDVIQKILKKVIIPHFLRSREVKREFNEKISNPYVSHKHEYLEAVSKLPIYSASNKSIASHIAHLESNPNVELYSASECYTKGKSYYDKDQYDKAIPWFLHAANSKHLPAYRRLADSYNNTEQFQKAHSWYKRCIKDLTPGSNDYWFACMILGGMYKSGRGCEKNYDTSLYYLRLFHQNTTPINKTTANEMIAEVIALKNKANSQHRQSASSSSSRSQSTSRSSHSPYTPAANTMPNDGNRHICYKNRSGGIASINPFLYKNEWKAGVYVQDSSGAGHTYGFTRQYTGDTEWVFKGGVPTAFYSNDSKKIIMYVAFDWSYIKVDGVVYDIPISKQEYDSRITKVKVYMNNGGGHNHNNSSSSYNNNDSGRSYIDGPCKYCGGGGGCRSCNGRGYKYNPYSGHDDTCPSCNGSGRCFNCRGTGKQATY